MIYLLGIFIYPRWWKSISRIPVIVRLFSSRRNREIGYVEFLKELLGLGATLAFVWSFESAAEYLIDYRLFHHFVSLNIKITQSFIIKMFMMLCYLCPLFLKRNAGLFMQSIQEVAEKLSWIILPISCKQIIVSRYDLLDFIGFVGVRSVFGQLLAENVISVD